MSDSRRLSDFQNPTAFYIMTEISVTGGSHSRSFFEVRFEKSFPHH